MMEILAKHFVAGAVRTPWWRQAGVENLKNI